ncbi:hypothetical protein ACAW74_09265 [Fibrella sp. WM1]|uniref:hypothetical protein n=1 Tax=Fibrella musci TaxID=3242485 RepID=UPI0035228C60
MPTFSTNLLTARRPTLLVMAWFLLSVAAQAQPKTKHIRASVGLEGFSVGFPDSVKAGGKPFWFEASAVLYDGRSVLIAHDKPMPNGQASVGVWENPDALNRQQPPTYFTHNLFKRAIKYEELAQTPDRKWVFLTTAFDRVKEGSNAWDTYNMLLCWPAGKPSQVRLLGGAPTISDSVNTSVALRDKISSAIALSDLDYFGLVRYFKIEGLTATANRLFFGVREEGNSFQDFKPVVRILSVPYQVLGNGGDQHVELTGDFSLLGTINVAEQTPEKLAGPLALSSLEYDPVRKLFWIITTHESGENVGAYLWTATEAELSLGTMTLVRTPAEEPLYLTHKAEDMTFLTPNTILLIHDDDRLPTRVADKVRQPNQSAFTVMEVK